MESQNFQRQVFSTTYLTILGIVQASAFTYLVTDTLEYVRHEHLGASTDLFVVLTDMHLVRSLGTLMLIAVATFEYAIFAMIYFHTISARDVVLLFVVGVIEFGVASQTATGLNWWLMAALACGAGVIAQTHPGTFDLRVIFAGDESRMKAARRHNIFSLGIFAIGAAFAACVALMIHGSQLQPSNELVYALSWFLGIGTMLFWNTSLFLKELEGRGQMKTGR